jgi:hypothetical protein
MSDTTADESAEPRRGPPVIVAGDPVVVRARFVALIPPDGDLAGGVSVRINTRWARGAFQQIIIPIEEIIPP